MIHSKNKVLAAALLLFLLAEMRNLEWSWAGAEWKQSFKSEEEFAAAPLILADASNVLVSFGTN